MVGSSESLEKDKKSTLLLKHWSCRQFLVLFFAIGASALAYADPSFRATYGNLVSGAIGGYLAQMHPQGKD